MRRRDFLAAIGGVTLSSLGAGAQNTGRTHRIGLFTAGLPLTDNNFMAAPTLRGLATGATFKIGLELLVSLLAQADEVIE
jgi:hypothetical protein